MGDIFSFSLTDKFQRFFLYSFHYFSEEKNTDPNNFMIFFLYYFYLTIDSSNFSCSH